MTEKKKTEAMMLKNAWSAQNPWKKSCRFWSHVGMSSISHASENGSWRTPHVQNVEQWFSFDVNENCLIKLNIAWFWYHILRLDHTVSRLFQGSYKGVSRKFGECFKDSMVFHKSFIGISPVLHGSVKFQKSFKEAFFVVVVWQSSLLSEQKEGLLDK